MSLQRCPRCSQIKLHWYLDEEISDGTIWECEGCGFRGIEYEEGLGRDCAGCGGAGSVVLLDDLPAKAHYYYCLQCGVKTSLGGHPYVAETGDQSPGAAVGPG